MKEIVDILVWIMACYGMTTIVVNSSIFQPVREFFLKHIQFIGKLVNCFLCTSFWAGVFWTTLFWSPLPQMGNLFLNALFGGCVSCTACWILYLKVYPLMHGK